MKYLLAIGLFIGLAGCAVSPPLLEEDISNLTDKELCFQIGKATVGNRPDLELLEYYLIFRKRAGLTEQECNHHIRLGSN